jgi:hypothetical protein
MPSRQEKSISVGRGEYFFLTFGFKDVQLQLPSFRGSAPSPNETIFCYSVSSVSAYIGNLKANNRSSASRLIFAPCRTWITSASHGLQRGTNRRKMVSVESSSDGTLILENTGEETRRVKQSKWGFCSSSDTGSPHHIFQAGCRGFDSHLPLGEAERQSALACKLINGEAPQV